MGAAAQPFDAAAAVLDGSLLGASETAWVSRSALLVSASVVAAMYTTKRLHGSLFFVWCAAAHALCLLGPACISVLKPDPTYATGCGCMAYLCLCGVRPRMRCRA